MEVAADLIGWRIVRRLGGQVLSGRIVETEAYMGREDPASHAFRGPRPRNLSMFGPSGHLYVYRSHGIHACANIVTGPVGAGSAVLIRAVEPVQGVASMRKRRGDVPDRLLCAGPGRFCQAFAITMGLDGADLRSGEITLISGPAPRTVEATPRIGIGVATDEPWRFVDAGSSYLSRPLP